MKTKTVSPVLMFVIAIITFIVAAIFLNNFTTKPDFDPKKHQFILWFFRVITALAASGISIAIPGMLKVSYNTDGSFIKMEGAETPTLIDKAPTVIAGGALAVFVLVYLFNPINGL